MSDQEQLTEIGRTVEEYAACKRKLAALRGQAVTFGRSLQPAAQFLSNSPQASIGGITGILKSLDHDLSNLPGGAVIVTLLGEMKSEMERKQHLHDLLLQMGAEPKD